MQCSLPSFCYLRTLRSCHQWCVWILRIKSISSLWTHVTWFNEVASEPPALTWLCLKCWYRSAGIYCYDYKCISTWRSLLGTLRAFVLLHSSGTEMTPSRQEAMMLFWAQDDLVLIQINRHCYYFYVCILSHNHSPFCIFGGDDIIVASAV